MNALRALLEMKDPTVLLYHGVTDEPQRGVRNYTGKHLHLDTFVAHCRELAAFGRPCTIDEVVAHARGDLILPPGSFTISFDDGFRNVAEVAAPVLSDLRLPAIFYITGDFMACNSMSWVDRIEAAVDTTTATSVEAPDPIGGSHPLQDLTQRIAFMREVRQQVKAASDTDPDAVADEVCDRLGVTEIQRHPPFDDKLDREQVSRLAAHDGFSIGGHGWTHRILAQLTETQLATEVDRCVAELSAVTGNRIRHFAYPEGFEGSFSDTVVTRLASLGVISAATTIPGANHPGTNPYRLHREFIA